MLASPIVLLMMMELILRSANYGGDMSLLTIQMVRGKEYYSINRTVSRRYFTKAGFVPQLPDGMFEVKKGKRTKRIFCLGESTMAGFPYEYFATAPSFLSDRLRTLLPEYNIEVVNFGLSAVGTFVVQDFMDELLSYQPDLFIIYVGHNEFYGVYGVGSSITVPGGAWLTRLNIALLKFRTFLMLRDAYLWARSFSVATNGRPSESLMGAMVGDQTIPLDGRKYETAREIYDDNLERLIKTAHSHDVPIMFSTLVSNWRTQKPFVSVFNPATSNAQQTEWHRFVSEGDSLISLGRVEEAIRDFAEATHIDSMNATAFFKLGTALYSTARYDEARSALIRAKDLDALRFRATEEFNNDLVSICNAQSVPLARVDSAFIDACPHGILDSTLLLEHVHPNINGYFRMAKTFCQSIKQNHLLVPSTAWSQSTVSDSALMDLSRVTVFDWTVGKVKIDLLERNWPFETGPANYQFVAANPVESVVFRMMKGGIAWAEARYLLAEFDARNGRFDLARKECLAVARVAPAYYEPLLRYAGYYEQEGRVEEAKEAYRQCYETDDNPFARLKYGALLLDDGKAESTVAQVDTAFSVDTRGKYRLSAQMVSAGKYLLGVAYAKLGKIGLAKMNLEQSLAIDPSFGDARNLLHQLQNQP